MAVLVNSHHQINGHIHTQLTRSLERILEEANQSGELRLSNRKLKDFPKTDHEKYSLSDTVIADLSKNRFSELPEEVTNFHYLEKLQCYHNAIRFIPDSVSSLRCLSFLDLSRNQLSSLPRELCQLPIQILLVSNNRLTSLPDELSRMTQLTELDASCNQLTHLPPRLGDLRSLQSLVLRNNLLLAVPIELTVLNLVRLDLRANRITSLPIEMRDMVSLIDLLIEDNPLTSPPASLCKRGRVHIYKYLEIEAIKLDRKNGGVGIVSGGGNTSTTGIINSGTLGRRSKKSNNSSPGPPLLADRLTKHKRHNVDSGYSTSSDCYDKRWSQEITGDEKQWSSSGTSSMRSDLNGASTISTPSTLSPALDRRDHSNNQIVNSLDDDYDKLDGQRNLIHAKERFQENGNFEDKPLHQIQTYREYKEALKQQRAHDVPSIYRTKDSDDGIYTKTEPNTPTHHLQLTPSLATSKSDPTPLNSAFAASPKHIFDDTVSITKKSEKIYEKPVQMVTPSRNTNFTYSNGNSPKENGYIKPKSPTKTMHVGIMSHDSVPAASSTPTNCNTNGKAMGSKSYTNGMMLGNGNKSTRNISWNADVPIEKMSFTMRREIDKAREETDLINQLRNIIEARLKMALPEDLAPALTDGVVLCHLANHIKPRSVASIHVPSPAVPKLTMARCRRNVDNFIEACRKIGVDEGRLCSTLDVTEALMTERGLGRLLETVSALCEFDFNTTPTSATADVDKQDVIYDVNMQAARQIIGENVMTKRQPSLQDTTVSLLLLTVFFVTVALLFYFPPQ